MVVKRATTVALEGDSGSMENITVRSDVATDSG